MDQGGDDFSSPTGRYTIVECPAVFEALRECPKYKLMNGEWVETEPVDLEGKMPPTHNVIRFDIRLGHVFPMIDSGEISVGELSKKLHDAIVSTVNSETSWQASSTHVIESGGDGSDSAAGPLHHEVIEYDFS